MWHLQANAGPVARGPDPAASADAPSGPQSKG